VAKGLGEGAVNLFNAAQEIGKISWSAMQTAAISLGEAAQHLNDAVNALANVFPTRGTPEEIAKAKEELEKSGGLPKTAPPSGKGFPTTPYAFGGIVTFWPLLSPRWA
jgi:hypothetical protein